MTKLQIGAQMFSVRDRCTNFEDMLACAKQIKALGYNTCQLSGHGRDITPDQLRAVLDESGLTCACTHITFQQMEEDLDAVIRNHKLFGCAYPGIGGLPGEYRESPEGYLAFAKKASAIAEKLLDHGMHFIYHNHAFEFQRFPDCGKTGLELLLAHTSSAMQFELDVFWVQAGGGDPIDWIRRVQGRMDVVHFKEMNGGLRPPVMAPIGAGNLNWPAIMAACDEIGVKYAMIEQDNAVESDSIECMRVSHDNLLAMGGRF